jgi:uncharacterized protein YcbK (DUF882 family)
MSFAGISAGCLLLLALAGCVSPDGPLSAQNSVTADSPASAPKEDASSGDGAKTGSEAAAADSTQNTASSEDGPEDKTASAPVLAMAGSAPQSPALAAANSAVAGSGKRVAAPTLSPRAESDGTETPASEPETASAAQDTHDEPPSSADPAASAAPAEDPAPAAEERKARPLFSLFSSRSRTEKQARSPSPRARGTASAAEEDEPAQAAAPSDGDKADPTEIDDTEVASIDDEHEEMESLPGVRLQSLYGFQDGDAAGQARIELASAAGMARVSPGFLVKQRESVQTACLKPALLGLLKRVEYHFNAPVVITSGYRGPRHNRRVGGVRRSKHMSCEAADIQVEGVSKWEVARYVRSLPGRGGVGTYCYTDSVHVDIGEKRDWNWRCRRRK